MAGSNELIPSEDIDGLLQLCGCSGKPSTSEIIEPAIHELLNRNDIDIQIEENLDVGIISATSDLTRKIQVLDPTNSWEEGIPKVLVATCVDSKKSNEHEELRDFLVKEYRNIPQKSTIIKGHTINTVRENVNFSISEYVITGNTDRVGNIALNIDVIHALPQQSGVTQASIAVLNAINDCYTVGGYCERIIRPIVIHPSDAEVSKSDIIQVYNAAMDEKYKFLEPLVIKKPITDWLFGASVSTYLPHEPPTFYDNISVGDQILLHRPIGALAAYTAIVAGESSQPLDRVTSLFTTDHKQVAKIISKYCPSKPNKFDESKHIKFVTDISGSGIRGLKEPLSRSSSEVDIKLTTLPTIESELLEPAIQNWTVPDTTVETNGPLAICGSKKVINKIQKDLKQIPESNPKITGEITDGVGSLRAGNVNIDRYIETFHKPN